MLRQLQPEKWMCFPTAFAIVLGIPVWDLLDEIGHDGSEVIAPKQQHPMDVRAFHPQELSMCCWRRDYLVMPFEFAPCFNNPDTPETPFKIKRTTDEEIQEIVSGNPGVMCGVNHNGHNHAIAWDGYKYYDPASRQINNLQSFPLYLFYLIKSNREIETHKME